MSHYRTRASRGVSSTFLRPIILRRTTADQCAQTLSKYSESSLPLRELVGVGKEFRVGARAQFIEVHALALALHGHALRVDPIQNPVQAVSQRQHKTDQCGDAHQLREPLA